MATVNLKLRPWMVPNFATVEQPPGRRQDGWKDVPGIPLADIDPDTLSAMCDDYRAAIFANAGKPDPRLTP